MGKISDAIERHKKEKTFSEASAGNICTQQKCSDKLVVLSLPHSIDAENFKTLRARVLFAEDRKRPRTIMVTSAFPSEGKTFVSANLAVSIALGIDEYVLLVDCDLRRPSLHEMFGYTSTEGLHEYLTGKKELPDLIIRTQIGKLSLLPGGDTPPNPAELLSSTRMEAFLEEVKGRYEDRFIVIDSTPSQVTAETSVLARYVDGIILIVAKSYEGAEQIYKERGKKEDKFSHWRNPILRHRPAALKYAYLDPWYLAETLELKDGATKEGILLVTYHDVVAYHDG